MSALPVFLWGGPTIDLDDAEQMARAEAVYAAVLAEEEAMEMAATARAARPAHLRVVNSCSRPLPRRRSSRSAGADDDDGGDDGDREATAQRLSPCQTGERPPPRPRPAAPEPIVPRLVAVASLRLHPRADVVPAGSTEEYAALRADIKRDGVQEPLRVRGTVVLDGRHRLLIARELELEKVPVVEAELADGETDAAYMLRTALHRRHLSDDQRAVMAANWALMSRGNTGGGRRRAHAALQFGVSEHRTKEAGQLLRLDDARAKSVLAGSLPLSKALARVRREHQLKLIAATPPPTGTYRTIVIDPPWDFAGKGFRGAAAHQYPTMKLDELLKLPVPELAAPECHLYLWTPSVLLADGLQLLTHWGFRLVTTVVWSKGRLGLGHYFRNAHEVALFAVKGKAPSKSTAASTIVEGPVTRHSEKPVAFFERVSEVSHGPYLEMFARAPRPGWTTWGAEAGGRPPTPIHNSNGLIKGTQR